MPRYVVLSRLTAEGRRGLRERMRGGTAIADEVAAAGGKVVEQYALLGPYDFCSVVELSDNATALLLGTAHLGLRGVERTVLPAIDLELFARLVGQTTESVGPHRWQVRWPARAFRGLVRPYLFTLEARRSFRPLEIRGSERLSDLRGPAIFIANHTSNIDSLALAMALPRRYRNHTYWGAAADRWFLRGRRELRKQGWWRSLAYAAFPLQRGGGSGTLGYPEWVIGQGGSIAIFPEGMRSTSGKLARFRHGPALLALRRNVPVVPIYLDGLAAILPKGSTQMRAGPVRIEIGDPLRFAPGTTIPAATSAMVRALEALRERCRERLVAAAARDRPAA